MSILSGEIIEGRRAVRRANFFLKLNDLEKAKSFYKEALNFLPENNDILIILSQIEDDLETAIRYLRDAISINPDNKQAKYLLADALMSNNQFEEAYDLLKNMELPSDDTKLSISKIHIGVDLDTTNDDLVPSKVDPALRYPYALYHHKRENHSLAKNYLRNERTYQGRHLLGLQYLFLNDYAIARNKLHAALEQYKSDNFADGPIFSKLLLDSLLAIENPSDRISQINDNLVHFTKEDQWRGYEAMFVAWYNSGETRFSEEEARKWLEQAKTIAKDDELLIDKFEKWGKLLDD